MRLAAGSRLGPYEILALIGAGGMGEVYKARDSRLGRDVAVKILSPDTSSSPEARGRFEREARTISQLSHPHICALFDVGEASDPQSPTPCPYLVMELLEGETLADRIACGAVPLDQTVRYGVQIADALDGAHRRGIVHRDLKPSNVMITKAGVKLLDFGLAKPAALAAHAETAAPAQPLTGRGKIAGTVQYMAPELFAGRPADARSDIHALGAVIYEMATGRVAFGGSLQTIEPAALDRLVRTCMAADPDERWQSAHDVRLQLREVAEASTLAPAITESTAMARSSAPWAIAGAAILIAIAALLGSRGQTSRTNTGGTRPGVIRFPIAPPPGGAFSDTVETSCIALSPDGSQLAYVASDAAGLRRVWIRALSSIDARPLAGTDNARTVIWSPDGRAIAFFAGDKLKRLDVPDGIPVTVSDVPDVRVAASWGDGQILFSAVPGGIFRVPSNGGVPVVERAFDRAHGEQGAVLPAFLPDGKRYLYLSRRINDVGLVMIAEIGKPDAAQVLTAVSGAQYVDPGYLVFAREGTLVGQPFDAATGRTTGEAFSIADPVRYFYSTGGATYTVSRTGVLVYQAHAERAKLAWLDRAGKTLGVVSDSLSVGRVRLSPDGGQVLFDRATPNLGSFDLWRYDAARGVEQRITTDRLSEAGGVWLPNGLAIFHGGTPPHLFRRNLATGAQEELLHPPSFSLTEDVSPDGKTFVFTQRTPRGNFDIWTLPLGGGAPSPLLETPFDEMSVRFSRDGRYIAFASDESGRYEIYVAPFPTGEKVRVSAEGGNVPRWSHDGRELFYISGDLHLVSVPVQTSPTLTFGVPQRLFAVARAQKWDDAKNFDSWPDFDVSLDGTKFLAVIPQPANQEPLTAVLNWTTAVGTR